MYVCMYVCMLYVYVCMQTIFFRQAWVSLGDMPKVDAMNEFIRSITALCPSFTPYIKAHEAERRQQMKLRYGHRGYI